ncbi:MAG: hypothetical protein RBQ77_05820 [Candidatus Methanomethylophilaceae archaeon]|jgi:hypothetical protein|nr:hypothetical protein [Candidatus Methanomethylophilaceae archaeon]
MAGKKEKAPKYPNAKASARHASIETDRKRAAEDEKNRCRNEISRAKAAEKRQREHIRSLPKDGREPAMAELEAMKARRRQLEKDLGSRSLSGIGLRLPGRRERDTEADATKEEAVPAEDDVPADGTSDGEEGRELRELK